MCEDMRLTMYVYMYVNMFKHVWKHVVKHVFKHVCKYECNHVCKMSVIVRRRMHKRTWAVPWVASQIKMIKFDNKEIQNTFK